MKCLNCGNELENDARFCPKCGEVVDNNGDHEKFIAKKDQPGNSDITTIILGCFMFILGIILRPISSLNKKIDEYSNIKSAGILLLLVSFGRMIINLIGSMISVIFYKNINFWTGESKITVSFSNLKNLDYLSLIFKQFFGFIIVIAAVAGVYYIVSLIMKQTTNYFRLVAITTTSFVPFIIVLSFISIIISYIYVPASIFAIICSFIYSILIFVIAINKEINFDDTNFSIYFHTICLTVIFIISYYMLGNSLLTMIK